MNPYLVLGVPRDANDSRIRAAYLDAVKAATPESNPQRFKAVAAAYELIKDQRSRHRSELAGKDSPGHSPLEVLANYARTVPRPPPLSYESLRDLFHLWAKT